MCQRAPPSAANVGDTVTVQRTRKHPLLQIQTPALTNPRSMLIPKTPSGKLRRAHALALVN